MIGRGGERGSGISVLVARHDDDDDFHSKDIKYHITGNRWMLFIASASKNSVNAMIGDVGMLIGLQALKSLNSIEKIQPGMTVATFNGNLSTTIIPCYQTDSFIVSQFFSVAGRFKLGSKPTQLYVRLCILPLSQEATYISSGIVRIMY